jgi:hypothetical protein
MNFYLLLLLLCTDHCVSLHYCSLSLLLLLQVVPLSKQLTCLSGGLWSRTLRYGRAERIDYLLLHEFHERKFITPEKPVYVGNKGNGKVRQKVWHDTVQCESDTTHYLYRACIDTTLRCTIGCSSTVQIL